MGYLEEAWGNLRSLGQPELKGLTLDLDAGLAAAVPTTLCVSFSMP